MEINRGTGEVKVFARKIVVPEVEDSRLEVPLEEAKLLDPRYEIEDLIEFEVTPRDFGRIAAQMRSRWLSSASEKRNEVLSLKSLPTAKAILSLA